MSPEQSSRTGQQLGAPRVGRQILTRPTSDGPHPLRVLVVDDEPSICQALAMLFSWHGIEALTALTPASAMSILAEHHMDVLMIDLRLREARGDALFRAAIELDPTYRKRTLFMTGDITAEAERVIAATNCPYLRKPFDITLAVQAIAALVGISYSAQSNP